MSSDELDTHPCQREDVKDLRLPHLDPNRTIAQRSSSHLISSYGRRRWMSLPNPDEPNQTHPQLLQGVINTVGRPTAVYVQCEKACPVTGR